jgi:hypothetical protein
MCTSTKEGSSLTPSSFSYVGERPAEHAFHSGAIVNNFPDHQRVVGLASRAAGEIAEQIQILSNAAGVDWREELSWAIESMEEAEEDQTRRIDEPDGTSCAIWFWMSATLRGFAFMSARLMLSSRVPILCWNAPEPTVSGCPFHRQSSSI